MRSALARMMSAAAGEYDVVIVGGGPGGYVAAIKAAQLGLKTACVEKRGALGGTCLNVGCIPSKALLHASHMYHEAKHDFAKYGIKVSGVEVDLPAMMAQKTKAVKGLTGGIEGLFRKNKVEYVKGFGMLRSTNEVEVELSAGGKQSLKSKNIVIATGSEPTPIPNVPIDEKRIVSSTGALELPAVPKKMILIGGGVIGLEMGSVWSRLGSQVTVVEFLDRITPGVDLEIARAFQRTLTKQGMTFKLGTKVLRADTTGSQVKVAVQAAAGGAEETLEADVVLVAVGRRPYTERLGLKELGIEMEGRFIKVNKHLQTNKPGVFAIGDCTPGPMLAHKAEEEGIAVAEFIKNGGGHVNYGAIPGVIYTHPEVAQVGKTEEELKAAGAKYRVGKFPMLANSRARTNDDAEGLVKVLVDAETDRLLGVHIMSTNAGELIGEAVLGMEYGASAEDLARTCHPHPTLSEALKEACMDAFAKPIHF
jgi:dihydrolipoamide dehydrogenase